MGWIDRLRGAKGDTGSATVRVPEGHAVHVYRLPDAPGDLRDVDVSRGGLVLVGLGDERAAAACETVGFQARAALQSRRALPILSLEQGGLDRLFAPNNPRVGRGGPDAIWAVGRDAVGALAADPERLRRGIEAIGPMGAQIVYLNVDASGAARTLADTLVGWGVEVRAPGEGGAIVVEVQRPEGVVICGLVGRPYTGQRAGAAHALLEALAAAADGDETAVRALHAQLARHESPLMLIALPGPGGRPSIPPRSWPGLGAAFAAYPDAESLQRTAAAMGLAPGSYAGASMPPRVLFQWAADQSIPVVIGLVPAEGTPKYVLVPVDVLRVLARGEAP